MLNRTDTENWKDFIQKPALSYVLRLLTGISQGHPPTQLLIGAECIPILHKLEQASSDKHIGTMAENLLEALKKNPEVSAKVRTSMCRCIVCEVGVRQYRYKEENL